MRRILMASLVLAFVVPSAQAKLFNTQTYPNHGHSNQYLRLYGRVVQKEGPRAPGRNIAIYGTISGHTATEAQLIRSIKLFRSMLTPQSMTVSGNPATSYVASSGGGYSNVPGVPSSFAACVALRESTNGAGSSNIYGILGIGGQGTVAQQKQAFTQMYASRGVQPWRPWDGC